MARQIKGLFRPSVYSAARFYEESAPEDLLHHDGDDDPE